MKKHLLIVCAAVALAGCNRGGTRDQYSTETGMGTSTNGQTTTINAPPPAAAPSEPTPAPANPSRTTTTDTSSNRDVTRPGDRPNPSSNP